MSRFAPLAFALLLLPGMAVAQSAGLQQPSLLPPAPPPPSAVAPAAATVPTPMHVADDRVAFNATEQWMIPLYFQHVREGQKRAARSRRYPRALPAGLTHNPAKGEQLSPTVLAELRRLPGPLVRDLPPARPGTDRVIVSKDVLMVNTATGEVLDILGNVLF